MKYILLIFYLILLPNRLVGVMRLGSCKVDTCPLFGPSCKTVFTVFVTCPNSFGLAAVLLKLSRLSCEEDRESDDPLLGS